MTRLLDWALRLKIWKDDRGQDLVEYALLASMVTITVGALFPPAGDSISVIFSKLTSTTTQAP
jgi:Flp pilus assembly pilin Flp